MNLFACLQILYNNDLAKISADQSPESTTLGPCRATEAVQMRLAIRGSLSFGYLGDLGESSSKINPQSPCHESRT